VGVKSLRATHAPAAGYNNKLGWAWGSSAYKLRIRGRLKPGQTASRGDGLLSANSAVFSATSAI